MVVSPTLTIAEAAARLGTNPMDLWHLIHRGECPGLHHLGRYVIEESALNEVLEVLTSPHQHRPAKCPMRMEISGEAPVHGTKHCAILKQASPSEDTTCCSSSPC